MNFGQPAHGQILNIGENDVSYLTLEQCVAVMTLIKVLLFHKLLKLLYFVLKILLCLNNKIKGFKWYHFWKFLIAENRKSGI